MILVTLGTQDKEFTRLLKAIDREIEKKNIKEKVIVQAGYTKYESKNMEIFDLIPEEKLEELVKKCSILITHGGVGSILMGIKQNKPIIAAARLKRYKEHTNDHQKQIIKEFENRGYILELRDFNKLDKMIEKAKSFQPKKFISNTDNFVQNIENYIEEDNHISWFNHYRNLVSNGYHGIFLSLINILVFYLLNTKLSLIPNVLTSYGLTLLLSFILNLFIDIKYNLKNYMITNVIGLVINIGFIYLLINYFSINIMQSIIITIFILWIVSYILNMNKK